MASLPNEVRRVGGPLGWYPDELVLRDDGRPWFNSAGIIERLSSKEVCRDQRRW